MKNPRQIAVESLLLVDSRRAWSNRVLDGQIEKYALNRRDSAFVSALFYGVLERRITLDACIAAHSKTKPQKLSPIIREILRSAVYQILYLDSVPDSAAVSEAVNTAKAMGQSRLGGFVNGILRSFLRAGAKVPEQKGSPADELSVRYSAPPALVRLWLDAYGRERAEAFLSATLGRPPLYLRVNPLRTSSGELADRLTERGFRVERDKELPSCLRVDGGGSPAALPEHREGLFHIQDRSSQQCAAALGAKPGMRVLDLCAAPGGKTFTLAQEMEDRGELAACDLHDHRVAALRKRVGELGLTCIRPQTLDATEPHPELGIFDRVLCDVPCSGLGVIRRKPEIKYKPLEEFEGISNTQYKILENAANYCKAGGVIVYSTCTLNPVENELVVERFLAGYPEFRCVGGLRDATRMNPADGDGFFFAVLSHVGGR